MGVKTKISYCDSSVNPIMGCTGCALRKNHCYAAALCTRYAGCKGWPQSFDQPEFFPGRLEKAVKWSDLTGKDRPDEPWLNGLPRRIFVNDLSDGFCPDVDAYGWLLPHLDAMEDAPHIWLLLTKWPERMGEFFAGIGGAPDNFHLGVSVENQAADERIPLLLQTPAAVRFVSCEPLLSVVQLGKWLKPYKVEVQNERERNGISKSTCNRCILSGQGGSNLALPQIDSREPARFYTNGEGTEYPNTRRTEHVERLSQSDVHSEQQAVFNLCAPSRLDDCESVGYSTRVGDQPQERDTLRQQARELGASDTTGERTACRSSFEVIGQKRSEGGEELNLQTDGATSPRDSEVMGRWRSQSNNDRENIRNLPDNDKQYCLPQDLETPPISWVICGGESGPGARPMHPDWARSLRDQCQAAGVPFFFKSWGAWIPVDQYGATCQEKVAIANSGHVYHWADGSDSLRVGKKRAGHLLDGREWQQFPVADGAGNR